MIPTSHSNFLNSKSEATLSTLIFHAVMNQNHSHPYTATSQQQLPPSEHSTSSYSFPNTTTPANQLTHDSNSVPTNCMVDGTWNFLLPVVNANYVEQSMKHPSSNQIQEPVVGTSAIVMNQPYDTQASSDRNGNRGTAALRRSSCLDTAAISSKECKKRNVASSSSGIRDYVGPREKKPRPMLHVEPNASGPIHTPNVHDVLCGRGGRVNTHTGNIHLREIVQSRQYEYLSPDTKKLEKAYIAADIVATIRHTLVPPGRFLQQNPIDHSWSEIGDERAIRKVLQALREHAPEIRTQTK
jgi:hypothetical protein